MTAVAGREDIIRVLIAAGADIDAPTKVCFLFTLLLKDQGIASHIPLQSFCTPMCPSNIRPCHRYTLPSSPPLQDGGTPLHWAARNDHLESVRLLIDRGADKDAKNNVRGEGEGLVGRLWLLAVPFQGCV